MAHKPYYNKNGQIVPSVTTVIGRFKESSGLIWWAWDCGMKGINYTQVRDEAAIVGTILHDMIEASIKKIEFKESDYDKNFAERAKIPFEAFRKWHGRSNVILSEAEISLISEEYQYGGMLDALPNGNELYVIDWKSTKRIYPDHIVQVAAYRQLWNENNPVNRAEDGHIVRFDKETGAFQHMYLPKKNLDRGFTAFLHMRLLYDSIREVDKICR